jgi:hypothetical protein
MRPTPIWISQHLSRPTRQPKPAQGPSFEGGTAWGRVAHYASACRRHGSVGQLQHVCNVPPPQASACRRHGLVSQLQLVAVRNAPSPPPPPHPPTQRLHRADIAFPCTDRFCLCLWDLCDCSIKANPDSNVNPGSPIAVSAKVRRNQAPVAAVTLLVRINYAPEQQLPMTAEGSPGQFILWVSRGRGVSVSMTWAGAAA